MADKKLFLTVDDVMKITSYKQSKAYRVIRELNNQLRAEGKLVFDGRVLASYFYEQCGGRAK